jgi:hypothetical protein
MHLINKKPSPGPMSRMRAMSLEFSLLWNFATPRHERYMALGGKEVKRQSAGRALFFPLFLLGRSRNLHERGGGLGDLRLLLFRLLGFTLATNLTFRHRNSPLMRLAGCEHSITRSAGVSVQSRPIRSDSWAQKIQSDGEIIYLAFIPPGDP